MAIIITVALVVLLGGWWAFSSARSADRLAQDVSDIKSTVIRYNAALIKGFEAMNMEALNIAATRDQAYTEFYQMSALGEGRVRLVPTLNDIKFLAARVESPETSTVDTVELWDYRQVSLDTSKTVRAETGVVYKLTYRLVRRGGRWLVDEVKITGNPWRNWSGSSVPATETTPTK